MCAAESRRPWLIMLYLAGDNNLTEDMVLALQDLLAVSPLAGDKIVAQFDPSGLGLATQRYDFSDRTKPDGTTKVTLEDYRDPTFDATETNTGSPETLTEFLRWAISYDSTDKQNMNYLLILSGHGSGTTEDFLLKDDNAVDSLSIPELKEVLETATAIRNGDGTVVQRRKIDILGMDACYMSMGEVANEISDHVGILIGAEGLEPAFGWPYRRILETAKKHVTTGPMEPPEL